MKEEIIGIIKQITNISVIDSSIDLIENEILDSLAFIEFVNELEDRYDIEVQPTQVDSSIWRNIDKIVKFVEEKISH